MPTAIAPSQMRVAIAMTTTAPSTSAATAARETTAPSSSTIEIPPEVDPDYGTPVAGGRSPAT
ncbi:hypothetical protein GCM10011574_24820 [Microbispora bryophytorum]|uniref:Uncharacterized protein n=1 Tax=Microbispora bryophytorum TaxID=1460882 RepID=A0A8H9GY69_9ACTN|nr:hypothetical protein GCM10011574_24820 [Microbispora bryophytorum]